jgi:hypothetical protein
MLPFSVTIPATVPQGSEIPEGLMNNSVCERNSRIHWDRLQNKDRYCKGITITAVLDKIQELRRNWVRRINRMARTRVPRIMKKLQTKRQKKQGEDMKETSRSVRQERIKSWANCVLGRLLLLS